MSVVVRPNRKRTRLAFFDYATGGAYFVTICTENREHFFGEIHDDKMILNDCGKIVVKCWQEIPTHFPDTKLDEFVVMPNHIHGIVRIGNSINGVENAVNLENADVGNGHARSSSKKSNLSAILGSFKSAASKEIHQKIRMDFAWQKSFHDHIIRDDEELNLIREYISSNPENWAKDKNNF
ncbi:transposase [Candidatus Gracilibacteria bacterium]|nr:transposase [Candidatus Gracilibacteria bacterium]MCF7856092.1 transposase [Candidatus Gracilibacteria bacterium]MCF7896511.1 transposase [Candidatus Gracilibacteria bacterium]